jgi:uncharacterized protein YbjT (DUF2867 family)
MDCTYVGQQGLYNTETLPIFQNSKFKNSVSTEHIAENSNMTIEKLNVVIAGASGETGKSITYALLSEQSQFRITALARASSSSSDTYDDFASRGAIVKTVDFKDTDGLVAALTGADAVLCCLQVGSGGVQDALMDAAYKARVGRFIPSFWATIGPRGVMGLRDAKEASLDRIQRLSLPYTIIDVGWWFQISLPRVPSGKLDGVLTAPETSIGADGNTRMAITDLADVGKFVAKVIADPRTLNKRVFCYGEVTTQNQIFSTVESITGETIFDRQYLSMEEAEAVVARADEAIAANPADMAAHATKAVTEYKISYGIRGDNTPEYAKYLGYLDAKKLYPDLETKKFEEFVKGLVDGARTAKLYVGKNPMALDN